MKGKQNKVNQVISIGKIKQKQNKVKKKSAYIFIPIYLFYNQRPLITLMLPLFFFLDNFGLPGIRLIGGSKTVSHWTIVHMHLSGMG